LAHPIDIGLTVAEAKQLLAFCTKYQRRESEFTMKLRKVIK